MATLPTRPVDWRTILWLSLLGTTLATFLVILEHQDTRALEGGIINPGEGPATEVVVTDFPDMYHPDSGRHDGPMNYAIARDLPNLGRVADSLDRPAYRLQRLTYPAAARLLYPPGRGQGLLAAMIVVGVLALFLAGVSAGGLSSTLGGPTWLALLMPLAPGCLVSLRISVSDTLAIALALAAVTLSLRNRTLAAALVATGAVLTKESMFLIILGLVIWRRDRGGMLLAVIPAGIAGVWAAYLSVTAPAGDDAQFVEFTRPLHGLWVTVESWSHATEIPQAAVPVVIGLGLGAVVLVRDRLRHPLSWPIILNLLLLAVLRDDIIRLPRNGTRAALPLLALAVIAFATPKAHALLRAHPESPERELVVDLPEVELAAVATGG